MTVASNVKPSVTYISDGAQRVFGDLNFTILDDLCVEVNGVAVPFDLADDKSTVTLSSAPLQGVPVRVFRKTDIFQPTSYNDLSKFPAAAIEANFDRITHILQDLACADEVANLKITRLCDDVADLTLAVKALNAGRGVEDRRLILNICEVDQLISDGLLAFTPSSNSTPNICDLEEA